MGEHDKLQESGLLPMRAQDYSEMGDWPGYFRAVLGKEPRETLVRALDLFTDEAFAGGLAVDIAAGEGRDTLELLKRGWKVVATDSHPDAFSYLWPRVLPRTPFSRGRQPFTPTLVVRRCILNVAPLNR